MNAPPSQRPRFGAFELDLSTGELRSTDTQDPNNKVLLREQVFQVLRMLLEHQGKIVTREEIKERLWANDTVVDFDQSINATIKALRRGLGDSADNPRYIETLGRRGYRLMPAIEYPESTPGIAPRDVTAEFRRIRWRWRTLPACVLLAVGALSAWRYEVYRHRITIVPTDTIVLADIDNRTSDPVSRWCFEHCIALRNGADAIPKPAGIGQNVLGHCANETSADHQDHSRDRTPDL
jgi:DNA-binding winged helix-turn-helix (wHTH) protein